MTRGEVTLPEVFATRLLYEEKATTFNVMRLPFIKGYLVEGLVQYNEEKKHFRVLKMMGRNKVWVRDGCERIVVEGESEKKDLVENTQWVNYIAMYRAMEWRGRGSIEGAEMMAEVPKRAIVGGGEETKERGSGLAIMTWNVNGGGRWQLRQRRSRHMIR